MNLSLRWLNELIKLDVLPRKFAEDMTMSGSKVEGYTIEGSEISGVVVGKIMEIQPHENADSLVVCKVSVGKESDLQIVTGAKNLYVGAVIPVAMDGAVLPGGKTIKSAPLRKVESQGMLCSLSELGLTANDFPYAKEDGIFILQEQCVLGQDICAAIGLNDTSFEFEITSNRPDCLSVLGLAREAAVTYGVDFVMPQPVVKGVQDDIHQYLSVEVLNPTLCPRYIAKVIKNIKIAPSPRWLRERLRASGVRPINNIVDITNYVMLEYGQPLHAFDLKYVKDSKLTIRNAAEGESITTLDGVQRKLTSSMLVIADGESPSAIAGVMGGEFSSIHEDTTTIVFESANFLGSSVRTTSRKLGLRTESSGRYEKGLDPDNCLPAVLRACELVELLGAGEVISSSIDINNSASTLATVQLDHSWINSLIGIELSRDKMVDILIRLGFSVEGDTITVPTFRGDVRLKADIAEEIARFYGYDKIPSTNIRGTAQGMLTTEQKFERLVISTLIASGLNEVVTYTFISPKSYDKICMPENAPSRNSVVIMNPLGEDTSIMRTDALPSMMEVLSRNYNNRNISASLFEIAKEFYPNEDVLKQPTENIVVSIGMYGANIDYYTLKGVLEKLLATVGIKEYDVEAVTDNKTFHPGRTAKITVGGTPLAILGQVHPTVCANYEVDVPAYMAKIDFSALMANAIFDRTYRSMPRYPASSRDLAIICEDILPVIAIEKVIKKAIPDILEEVALFDVYRGAQVAVGKKSVAYKITLRAADRTLTENEVNQAISNTLQALLEIGAELRV